MVASLQEVKDALSKLGIRAEIVDSRLREDKGEPVLGLNVWMGDQTARYPDDTVWPPIEGAAGSEDWIWGDHFQWGIQGDADADLIAQRIINTVRTRS